MRERLFLSLTLLTALISTGCGGGSSVKAGSTAVAPGELAVSPSTLSFGRVTVGTKESRPGTLTAGDSRITVTSADWNGEGFSIGGVVFPLTIPAGQSVPFKVVFAPKQGGISSGKLTFQSDADNSPQMAFSGKGTQTAAHKVSLTWKAPSTSIAGFNVYRGTASKGPFTRLNSSVHLKPNFTDASVVGGSTYFYATTSVNRKGQESKYSNRVQVTIPNS